MGGGMGRGMGGGMGRGMGGGMGRGMGGGMGRGMGRGMGGVWGGGMGFPGTWPGQTGDELSVLRAQADALKKQLEQITITEDLAADLPRITGDANQLQQVLLNLLLNACEAMPDGGRLSVKTFAESGKTIVRVADTGCGIKAGHLDEIFEPFFSTKPVGKGTGLGLSVSYGIIQQHNGTLEVESEEGKGTTLTIVLPAIGDRPSGKPNDKVDR